MNFLSRFRKSTSGLAAIEFAFILPVMVTMFLGVVEVSNYVMAARRVANVSATAADLVAQDTLITNSEMTDIMGVMNVLIAPMNPSDASFVITSVQQDTNGVNRVMWSEARNGTARIANSIVSTADLPVGLLSPFQGVVMTEITFGYEPMFASFLSRPEIKDKFYLKPRRSLWVQRGP